MQKCKVFFKKSVSNSKEAQRELGSADLRPVGQSQELCNKLITKCLCVFHTMCSVGQHLHSSRLNFPGEVQM